MLQPIFHDHLAMLSQDRFGMKLQSAHIVFEMPRTHHHLVVVPSRDFEVAIYRSAFHCPRMITANLQFSRGRHRTNNLRRF